MTDRDGPGVVLVLGAGGSPPWAELSPTDWVILEALALEAEEGADGPLASVGVRRLGATLGMSKNTVAAAVGRLAAGGLIARLEHRPGAPARYRLALPAGMLLRRAGDTAGRGANDVGAAPGRPIVEYADGVDRHACRRVAATVEAENGVPDDGDPAGHAAASRAPVGRQRAGGARRSGARALPDEMALAARASAEDGSQGQLFDPAVTAGSQDPES